MDLNPKIDILLAAYEGEKFLAGQIDSILNQTYQNFRLFIRDDASSDQTPSIAESYVKQHPGKIVFIPGKKRMGVKSNFSELMEISSAPYIMFSDQDDVWMPYKLESSLEEMLRLEKFYGNQPYLIHSDLSVVDEQLQPIDPSFWNYAHLNPATGESLNRLLNQNVVTGCTVMANRLLIELAKPIPYEAFMHDWWLALTAACFGKIGRIQKPTLYYRQHTKNTLGAQKFGSFKNLIAGFRKLNNNEIRKFQQASVFYHRYHDLFDADDKKTIKAFLNLQLCSWGQKRYSICKHGFFKQGFLRNFADFIFG